MNTVQKFQKLIKETNKISIEFKQFSEGLRLIGESTKSVKVGVRIDRDLNNLSLSIEQRATGHYVTMPLVEIGDFIEALRKIVGKMEKGIGYDELKPLEDL